MNATYTLLNQIQKNNNQVEIETDFVNNLKTFRFLINERFIKSASNLQEFLDMVPDYIIEIFEEENILKRLYAKAQEQGTVKLVEIEPLDEEDIGVKLIYTRKGSLNAIILYNDKERLILNSANDVVTYEKQDKTIKLVDILKDHYSINVKYAQENEFKSVHVVEKEKVSNHMKYNTMLFG